MQQPLSPYREASSNFIYNLLFCDDPELFRSNMKPPYPYPYDILFSPSPKTGDLEKITTQPGTDPRLKALAYNLLSAKGHRSARKELLGVIVEIGLEDGPDVLASFQNGTARYINQAGKVLIWETTDDGRANKLKDELFDRSREIIDKIGPWNKARRPNPPRNYARISFLVSDGLYFGEAPTDSLFKDPLASPALNAATKLLQYLVEKSVK
jgi:hypothetical protein